MKHQSRTRATQSADLIYGIRAVMEAIRSGREVERVLVRRNLTGDLTGELLDLAREHRVPVQTVPAEKFLGLGQRSHQGVMAYVSPVAFQPIEEVVASLWEQGQAPFLVLLDGVTDVRNLGAIVRTAECAGAHAVVIPAKGSARIGSDAVKTSAGALLHMPICRVGSLRTAITFLKLSGIRVVAASQGAATPYPASLLKPPIAVVLGAEDTGLTPETLRLADAQVSIPIRGRVESLNVSVAAGVLLFEVVRQAGMDPASGHAGAFKAH